jgi:signal recognition particle subunit SRP72
MAANPIATLTALLRGATIEDHEEVLKAANALLKSSKNNPDGLHTRVVALLKLDRFNDALRALDEGGDKLSAHCILEKAYALYKTGQLAEAEKLVDNADQRGSKHIAAQVAYRAEKFQKAAAIYKELSAQSAPTEEEENDLRINSAATDAQLEWQGNGHKVENIRKKPSREDLEAFETSYNAACGSIARGDLAAGSMLLKRARDLCEALDELTDEEKRTEVLPIMVQQAYVFTKLGKLEEAEALQRMINTAEYVLSPFLCKLADIYSVPEAPTRLIAQNNFLAAKPNKNPYMTERLFSSVPKLSHTDKLFEHQASILDHNRYAISLQTQKYQGVASSTASIIFKSPSPTLSPHINSLSILNAAAHAQGETGKAGLRKILPLLDERPNDVGLILTIIHLYIENKTPIPAITLLEAFFKRLEISATPKDLEVRFAPGLVALLTSLYDLTNRKLSQRIELKKAANYWRKQQHPSISLLRAAGTALLESSNPEDLAAAGEIFTSLRTQDPNDRTAISGYVAAYATTSFSKIEAELEKLTPISKLIAGVDAAALEEAGIPSIPTPAAVVASKKRSAEALAEKERAKGAKKRKIRPGKMPKDFEEGKVMDPERWLPLKDRSSYRPKGKKGKKKAMDLTQGGIVKEEESLELAGGAGTVKVQQQAGGGKAKKKKGKK